MSYTMTRTGSQINEKTLDVHGGIHTHDNSTAQTIATGASYVKVINFSGNDDSSNVTSDYSNNKITITKAGIYRVEGAFSFETDTNNVTAFGALFIDGVEMDEVHFERKIQTAGDKGNAGFTGIVELPLGTEELDFRIRHDNGSDVDFTMVYMNLNVNRIGL